MAAAAAKTNPDHLFARFAQTPALIDPSRQDEFEACVRALVSHEHGALALADAMGSTDDDFWSAPPDSWRASLRPYNVDANGILKVPVQGVLLNKFGYALGSYATGYQYIQRAIERGLEDPSVKGIALIMDSPGGEMAGNFELVDKIYGWRGTKPIRAFAYDYAYSAAYSIASAADSISMTRTGGVGSIGVVTMHVDLSGALEQRGIRITYIFAGKHKVDGNPYEKLPDNVRARIQKRIDKSYGIFTATVARNRDMDEKDVRGTEAATFGAEEAIEIGLADAVAVFEDAYSAFAEELRDEEGQQMSKTETAVDTVTRAEHDAAVTSARTEGTKAGVTAERGRIVAILNSDAGKARPNAALAAALETDMTAEQATAFLAKLPEESAKAASEQKEEGNGAGAGAGKEIFEAAMNNSGNPEVGATGGENAEQSDADRILASFGQATGYKAATRK